MRSFLAQDVTRRRLQVKVAQDVTTREIHIRGWVSDSCPETLTQMLEEGPDLGATVLTRTS